MAIVPPLLDDRTWKDLRDEALARVPIYTPEWTDLRPGDPGVTLVELFAYLTEALVYRLNRVPDNSYLAFLNLLDAPPRAAQAAKGLVQLANRRGVPPAAVDVDQFTTVSAGKVRFAMEDSLSVLPIELAGYIKCRVDKPRQKTDAGAFAAAALAALRDAQGKGAPDVAPVHFTPRAYPPPDGSVLPLTRAVDGALWIALLARKEDKLADVRAAIGDHYLSLGLAPADDSRRNCSRCTQPEDTGGNREVTSTPTSRLRFEITAPAGTRNQKGLADNPTALGWDQDPTYANVRLVSDTTEGLRRPGVIKLKLPSYDPTGSSPERKLATWDAVQPKPDGAGKSQLVPIAAYPRAGDLPPILDDGEVEKRVICWLRALPARSKETDAPTKRPREGRAFSWMGANAVDVTQAVRIEREMLRERGLGAPGQVFQLSQTPVIGAAEIDVLEDGVPVPWKEVENLDAQNERSSVYVLDRALGTITVGDGLRGRVVPDGAQLRATYSYGGGLAGNVPAGIIKAFDGPTPSGLDAGKITNPLPTSGGSETETVDQARRRVPMILRHQDRAVTAEDFRELATMTPGAAIGRVEVLPLYRPASAANTQFPGVVSVLVIPSEDTDHPRAPRPDRNLRELVCKHLDRHRLITTELYIIGPRYVPLSVSVGLQAKPGHGIEQIAKYVRLALFQFLSPLPPFGPDGSGWPLGGRINRAALEAAILQVDGVAWVEELKLYRAKPDGSYEEIEDVLQLGVIDLPELLQVDCDAGAAPPPTPAGVGTDDNRIAVPVPVPRTSC